MTRMTGVAFFLVLHLGSASASDWVYIGSTGDDIWSGDLETFDVGKSMWVRSDLAKPEPFADGMAQSVKLRYLFDCKAGSLAVAQALGYAGKFGKGAVIATKTPQPQYQSPPPDSIAQRLVRFACAPKFRAQVIADHREFERMASEQVDNPPPQ